MLSHFATYGRNEFPKAVCFEPFSRPISARRFALVGPAPSKPPLLDLEGFPVFADVRVLSAGYSGVRETHFHYLINLILRFRRDRFLHRFHHAGD